MAYAEQGLDLDKANAEMRSLSAIDRIRWAAEHFPNELVLLGSMQKTSSVITHMIHELGGEIEILFVDTGFHFHETLRYRDEIIRRYGVDVVTLYPERTPEEQEQDFEKKLHLFVDGQPECCRLRKEEPFLAYVRSMGKKTVMVGLRQSEGGRRRTVDPISPDPRIDGYAMHPIFDWSEADVDEYLSRHEVPYHPLHDQNYPSIGCACCTTPVEPGEDVRAGRWRHLRPDGETGPQYCGINFTDGSGI